MFPMDPTTLPPPAEALAHLRRLVHDRNGRHRLEELEAALDQALGLLEDQRAREGQLLRRVEQLDATLAEAQEQMLRFRELFEFAPDGFVVTNHAGVIEQANHAATVLLGRPKPFLLGMPLPFLVATEDRGAVYRRISRLGRLANTIPDWEVQLRPGGGAAPVYAAVTVTAVL